VSKDVTEAARRMVSVDALRGFDMFWLVGGTGLALAIVKLFGPGVQAVLLPQFDHCKWAGCTFYDLIYPLFIFVVGMSVVFSIEKYKGGEKNRRVYKRIARRFVLLFVLGVLFYGGFNRPWPDIRLLGVLQRIAICYLVAALLYYHFSIETLAGVAAGVLIGYWALFTFVPVPSTGLCSFTVDSNWHRFMDELLLPGRKYDGTWDNNGLLATLPAVATCLLGVFAALLIKSDRIPDKRKLAVCISGGLLMVALGWLWGFQFPVIKRIWSPSYVLVAGGYSYVLLGLFYLVVDVWQYRKWVGPFVWIGANPLTIYLAREFVDFNAFAERFVGGSIANAVGPDVAYLLQMIVSLALSLLVVWFLYRKKIFLRV